MHEPIIKVIIPAQNEAGAIGKVISEIPPIVHEIIVVDNGSTDSTAEIALSHGATIISVSQPGYGRACLGGIAAVGDCDIIVFVDGDASDYPEDLHDLVRPLIENNADLTIGSRTMGVAETGALTIQQRWGNALACFLIRVIWGHRYTDLGPFRAITYDNLSKLDMQAQTFGWTVEMQIRAVKRGLRCMDVPVRYRRRIGKSKISGTVKGVFLAGVYILGTVFKEAFWR